MSKIISREDVDWLPYSFYEIEEQNEEFDFDVIQININIKVDKYFSHQHRSSSFYKPVSRIIQIDDFNEK